MLTRAGDRAVCCQSHAQDQPEVKPVPAENLIEYATFTFVRTVKMKSDDIVNAK